MNLKGKNIFVSYLTLLGVRYTESFSNKYFNEHPHKYNLFGLSKMLSDYGIENAAIQIPDKVNNISEIQIPFIAQFGGDFAAVNKVEPEKVSFLWKGTKHDLPATKFLESWTGIVLLAEASESSGEPDYKLHRKAELLTLLKRLAFFSACGFIAIYAYIYNMDYTDAHISVLLCLNLSGLSISWLLLLKQMKVHSDYADKICSLFKQKDCNNVLESKAAKLFGLISWSEIGFGYFLTNVLLLLIFPTSINAIALINILTLPFTLWSVWYQKTKAKQWCILCLIIVATLWLIFLTNIVFVLNPSHVIADLFRNPLSMSMPITEFSQTLNYHLAFIVCFYFISILGINMLSPALNANKQVQSLRQSINSLKADEEVFKALLKKQPYYDTSDCDSIISFGNPDSKLRLTILTNPYCNPCSKMHVRIEELLKQVNNNISVRYILSSFNDDLKPTNKYLIAACLAVSTTNHVPIAQIFSDWFEKGKELKNDYFKSQRLIIEIMTNPEMMAEIEVEFQKHEAWIKKTKIKGTPTVLINGFLIPEIFKIEDLLFFTDLDDL